MTTTLRLMTWNVYQLPFGGDRAARLEPTIAFIARYADLHALDVVVLTEVFEDDAYDAILARLCGPRRRFSFASPRPEGLLGGLNDGGVVILARGFARLAFVEVYDAATATDAFAAKGAVGVEIDKAGRSFLVCGTHLQASYGTALDGTGRDPEEPFRAVREHQSIELARWIAAGRGRRRVVIAGDLNIDAGDDGSPHDHAEWSAFRARHRVAPPAAWSTSAPLRATYDPAANTLARITCEGDLRRRHLDHVLVDGPIDGARQWIERPETNAAWKRPEWVSLATTDGRGRTTYQLSNLVFRDLADHFPVFLELPC